MPDLINPDNEILELGVQDLAFLSSRCSDQRERIFAAVLTGILASVNMGRNKGWSANALSPQEEAGIIDQALRLANLGCRRLKETSS